MFKQLTLKHFLDLAKSKTKIAVYREISGDKITPIGAYHALIGDYKNISILESCGKTSSGRYSYLCLDPASKFTANNSELTSPFDKLLEQLSAHNYHSEHPLSQYAGGAVGFISYDAVRFIENIPDSNSSEYDAPEMFFQFYRTVVAFDHESEKVVISTAIDVNNNPELAYKNAMKVIDALIVKINSTQASSSIKKSPVDKSACLSEVKLDVDDKQYIELVKKAKKYIVDGDAFQIVLSRTFRKNYTAKPFDIYRALRITNPSPYMFYLEHDGFIVVGASPERLVSVKNNKVETNPIAGTRKRGFNKAEDAALENELLHDEKEIAEHMMLVDLGRNDLGEVCVPESIKVTKLKEIQKLSRVMHMTSLVEGALAKNKTIADVIKAVFPAGTLSGAPKIRAMEIIDELETTKRGLYGGAICIIDNQRNLDACIAIRMAVLKDNVAYVRAGAGIVFDSDPLAEAEETKLKAKAVLEAIDLAEGGL